MISYYDLKRNKYAINLIVAYLFIMTLALVFYEKNIDWFTFIMIISLFFYTLLLFSPRALKTISNVIYTTTIVGLSISIIFLWLFQINLTYVGTINDSQMLVFVTLLYVFLTYKIMRSHFLIYRYQRMPQLSIDVKNDLKGDIVFNIKNIGEYPAVDIVINFEIVHPIPKKTSSALHLFFQRNYNQLVNVFQNTKSTYIIRYFSEYLETNELKSISIEEKIQSLVDKEANSHGLDVIGGEFQIILDYDYKSVDNLNLEIPLFKLFKFRIEPTGIHLVHKSGNFKQLT